VKPELKQKLEECCAMPWVPVVECRGPADWKLSVAELPYFRVYGDSETQVREMFPEGLRAHLSYLLHYDIPFSTPNQPLSDVPQ
jgi:hypothetical protein